jgi:uncharacterized iron-regulated membrane protein
MTTGSILVLVFLVGVLLSFMGSMFWAERRAHGQPRPE